MEKLYPYSVMLEQFEKFGKYGAYIAAMLLPMLTGEPSDAPDLDEIAADYKEGKLPEQGSLPLGDANERYVIRLKGVFQDMVRLGYI